ncbi:MAG: hypothetical protein WD845_03595 [Pirellulales bacterium]
MAQSDMWQIYSKRVLAATLSVTVGLASLPGCGGSAYESLTNRRLDQLRASAPFRVLWGSSQIGESPVKIRVPMAYKTSYTPLSGHPDDGGRIKPDRFQPPFIELPGLQMCYEEFAGAPDGSRLPFYCYLAVIPNGNAQTQMKQLQEELKAKFPDTPDTWSHVDAKTPTDKAVPWTMIRVEGEQPFYPKNEKEPKVMPGILELWVHDAGSSVVLIGWRTPTSIDAKGAAAAGPGTNPFAQLTTQNNPDFSTMPALSAGTLQVEPPSDAPPAG